MKVITPFDVISSGILTSSSITEGQQVLDANFNSVVLLLYMQGTNGSTTYTDNSLLNKTPASVVNTTISNTVTHFNGNNVGSFTASASALTYNNSTDFDLPGDFTIEFWIYPTVNTTIFARCIINRRVLDATGTGTWRLMLNGFQELQGSTVPLSWTEPTLNTWHHMAVTRSGTTMRAFIDGALVSTGTCSVNFTNSQSLIIGRDWDSTSTTPCGAYISDLRITKGVCRYTSAFTAPTNVFPDALGTSLLEDPAIWNSATNYTLGTRVRLTSTKKIYENIVAGIDSTSPDVSMVAATPKWAEIGYTNKWAMFDTTRNSVSTASGSITVVITPGKRTGSVALLSMTKVTGISIVVTRTSTGATVYYSNVITSNTASEYVDANLPPYTDMIITVTLTGVGVIKVGSVVIGNSEYIGDLQYGSRISSNNFSTVTRDVFGTASMTKRGSVPKLSLTLLAKSGFVNRILNTRNTLNATPSVWVGLDNNIIQEYFGPLLIFGFYNTFSIQLTSPIHATINLEIEEI